MKEKIIETKCSVCGTIIEDEAWAKEGIHECCLISEMEYFEYVEATDDN